VALGAQREVLCPDVGVLLSMLWPPVLDPASADRERTRAAGASRSSGGLDAELLATDPISIPSAGPWAFCSSQLGCGRGSGKARRGAMGLAEGARYPEPLEVIDWASLRLVFGRRGQRLARVRENFEILIHRKTE